MTMKIGYRQRRLEAALLCLLMVVSTSLLPLLHAVDHWSEFSQPISGCFPLPGHRLETPFNAGVLHLESAFTNAEREHCGICASLALLSCSDRIAANHLPIDPAPVLHHSLAYANILRTTIRVFPYGQGPPQLS